MRRLPILAGFALITACHSAKVTFSTDRTAARIARITAGLRPAAIVKGSTPSYPSLATQMSRYNTPGVSIAVADSGRIVWAQGFGVKTVGTSDSVTATTLFQAASISKPVTATATLRLVDQGKLSLDENVNTYLTSWKVPDSRFTTTEKVTLRRILSHSAGLTVPGFPGYKVTAPLPNVVQILDGQAPANSRPVRVDTVPGTISRYSGGGVTVQQLLLTDVLRKPFPALMKELVLTPMGMTHSTFEQPLPTAMQSQAASAHSNGAMVPGRYHVYPEMAAAGLWTTPTDLLKWAMEVAAARAGKATKVLSRQVATQMLTPQKEDRGLGPVLHGTGRGLNFGHGGANQGFGSMLVFFPETGQGAAVMLNGGRLNMMEILYAIATEYQWPEYGTQELEPFSRDTAMLNRYVGRFAGEGDSVKVSREGSRLFVTSPSGRSDEAVLVARDKIVVLFNGVEGAVTLDPTGRATLLRMYGDVLRRQE